MTAMAETYLLGSRICQVQDDVPDEAIRLALLDYGTEVVEQLGTHLFPPYLQVVETEDGPYLYWLAEAFDPDEPEARILKRHNLRAYIAEVEGREFL